MKQKTHSLLVSIGRILSINYLNRALSSAISLLSSPFVIICLVSACATTPIWQKMTPDQSPNLTQQEAERRALQVADVSYQLLFSLPESGVFSGTSQIRFNYKPSHHGLRIDFHGGQILKLAVNEQPTEIVYNGQYLLIPDSQLHEGSNLIAIDFNRPYARNGRGFHQFTDPVDQRSYVYTNLEPFEANKVFPCFDQPDLKATYAMTVVAPKDWTVVTSVRESSIKQISPDLREWTFKESARFSTYIWSLHAGPFRIWEDLKFRYPLRLFARQSMAQYVKVEEWLPVTRQGFDFFDEYFGYAYPYKKYDQLIVPEFNSGAMENVAAVTFSERYLPRGEKPRSLTRSLANVIYHEMAHMWFGNLVTMKWWNDLWLNESFATYTAYLGLQESTEFKESWQSFIRSKEWAYWEDSRVTNHPIEGAVNDTLETFAIFDGITYGKGASVLKQLAFYLGPKNFQLGLKNYFKKYAEQNTVIDQFIGELAIASNQDLSKWKSSWLQTAGTNRLEAKWACTAGKISEFRILQQAAPNSDVLRSHAFEIAFLKDTGNFEVSEIFQVAVDGADTEIGQAKGRNCPAIVFLNHQDHGFFRFNFDRVSLKAILSGPNRIQDAFLRQLAWNVLEDSAEQEVIPFTDYFSLLLTKGFEVEQNDLILDGFNWSRWLAYHRKVLSPDNFAKLQTGFEEVLWERLTKSKAKSENQKIFFKNYVLAAESRQGLDRLVRLLDGRIRLSGFEIDPDKRWSSIGSLAKWQHSLADQLIEREAKKDRSAVGQRAATTARASKPDRAVVDQWVKELRNPNTSYSYQELLSAAQGLSSHDAFTRAKFSLSAAEYIEHLKAANDRVSSENQVALLTWIQPFPCGGEEETTLQRFAEQADSRLKPLLSKAVRQGAQSSRICAKLTAKVQSSKSAQN